MAVDLGGSSLCCEHATLGLNKQVYVCWKRSSAVVKTGWGRALLQAASM